VLSEVEEPFDVSICNPPFFEVGSSREDGFGGIEDELCTTGGEVRFIKQYMVESWKVKNKARIFSSLVGIKAHLQELERFAMKNFNKPSLKKTTLYQGKTLRWVIAWSFQ
jgi:23S rRNA A1618 N6-methylase RlmF